VVGLGGKLALAFGSRGQKISKAAAHFETSHIGGEVINLTKTNGKRYRLARWMHALEHYLIHSEQDGARLYSEALRHVLNQYFNFAKMEAKVRELLVGDADYQNRNVPPRERRPQLAERERDL